MATRAKKSSTKPRARKKSARKRDYAAEYARRVERAKALGLSKDVARGHPKPSEVGLAELRQLQRARLVPSPSGWVTDKKTGIPYRGKKGPKKSAVRHHAARRVAELADVTAPMDLAQRDRTRRTTSAEQFVAMFVEMGLGSRHEAYTLWFSP